MSSYQTSTIHPTTATTCRVLLAVLYCLGMMTGASKAGSIPPPCTSTTKGRLLPIYQYWIPGRKDHFYTQNINEIGQTVPERIGRYNAIAEGIAFSALSIQEVGTVPLFRYFHPRTEDHFYTTNANEIGTTTHGAVGKYGYQSEGITGYVYPTPRAGTVPLHRYYDGKTHDHFYTTLERLPYPQAHAYKHERIQCYVYTSK